MMQPSDVSAVHVWETAGLGKAPYRFLGVQKNWFCAFPGDPGKPGGSCDYCANGIAFEYRFQSADGNTFKVGCDCFYKANSDRSLKRVVDAAVAKIERAKREKLAAKKAAKACLEFAALIAELEGWQAHGGFAAEFGKSVARQVRKGKKPSERQLAVLVRLRGEVAA